MGERKQIQKKDGDGQINHSGTVREGNCYVSSSVKKKEEQKQSLEKGQETTLMQEDD